MTTDSKSKGWPVVAGAILVDRAGRILLQHRDSNAPTSPNTWATPGGHLESGETPAVAIRRELIEEIGIDMGSTLRLFRHILGIRVGEAEPYAITSSDSIPPNAKVIREISMFYGLIEAEKADLILGEGDALEFFTPDEAVKLDLALSAAYLIPMFVQSDQYHLLRRTTNYEAK
jgi:8-oxo-dGTP pyrophosphatase MutT (NUDIX family)